MRSFGLTLILAAGLCLLLAPSAAFAAGDATRSNAPTGYSTATLKDACTAVGLDGAVAFGITLKATITSDGATPATQLQIASSFQRRSNGEWVVVKRYPLKQARFAADGTSHTLQLKRSDGFLVPGGRWDASVASFGFVHSTGTTVAFSEKIKGTAIPATADCRLPTPRGSGPSRRLRLHVAPPHQRRA